MERKKLLIADDSEMNRAILANMLEQDFEIMEVSDGKEALAALQIYRKDLSALLLDVVMPGMDGFQVLEEMKQRQWLEDVPTVMISAETSSSYIDQAFELGAADYINRPFSATVVRRRIINTILLHTRRQEMMDILEGGPDMLDALDEELFSELVERIVVESNNRICFQLINGMGATESIERIKR